jgi:hypothetical protein
VTVFGTGAYTRADGSTGLLADASFATAALDKMTARQAEFASATAAAGAFLAVAAAAASSLVAVAEVETAPPVAEETTGAPSLQAVPPTPHSLEPASDPFAAPTAKPAVPAESGHVAEGEDVAAPAPALAALHDADPGLAASAALTGPAEPPANVFAAADAGGIGGDEGGQLMDQLLLAATVANDNRGSGHVTQDLAAMQEAFHDTAATQVVDAMVEHFVGPDIPGDAGADHGTLAVLFASSAPAPEAFAMPFDAGQVIDQMSELAAAQA